MKRTVAWVVVSVVFGGGVLVALAYAAEKADKPAQEWEYAVLAPDGDIWCSHADARTEGLVEFVGLASIARLTEKKEPRSLGQRMMCMMLNRAGERGWEFMYAFHDIKRAEEAKTYFLFKRPKRS
ncbi:MAG: hypothetical protein L0Z53_06085 [Acidobacteriales bacterium]|nr:hypothetical protein [Terriglobales bacterium]